MGKSESRERIPFVGRKQRRIHTLRVESTPVTLLVPEKMRSGMKNRMKELGMGSQVYFRYLLNRYRRTLIEAGPASNPKFKKLYQDSGQKLQKCNCRVENRYWVELTELAHGYGYSRCLLFVVLLEYDLGVHDASVVVPTPRRKRNGLPVHYVILSLRMINSEHGLHHRRVKMYELSRLRDPIVRGSPHFFDMDGVFNAFAWSIKQPSR